MLIADLSLIQSVSDSQMYTLTDPLMLSVRICVYYTGMLIHCKFNF